jgi:hypothetical protein
VFLPLYPLLQQLWELLYVRVKHFVILMVESRIILKEVINILRKLFDKPLSGEGRNSEYMG